MAMSAVTSLADHKEPRDVIVALILLYVVACMLCNPLRVSCLHTSAWRLILNQSGFNPHPEVD